MSNSPLTIGLYGDAKQEVVNRRFSGVLKYCAEHQIQVRDFRMINLVQDIQHVPPPWKRRVNGMVMCIGRSLHLPDKDTADWICSGGVPAVNTSADWSDPRVPMFFCNHASLAKIAANHLAQIGCESFLFVGYDDSTGSKLRGAAFRSALHCLGKNSTQHESSSFFNGAFEDEQNAIADLKMVEHLQKLPKPLGVWAINDGFASAVNMLCKYLNLSIPDQVRLLGSEDTNMAKMQTPMLSSIRTPAEEIGYKAMKTLAAMMSGGKYRRVTDVTNVKLVERESTTAVKRKRGDVQDALEFIANHACEGISVEELLRIVGGSRRAFQNRFLTEVGRTPREEIQRVRLEQAMKLLRETQLSMSRIAIMVGFQDIASFGKFFRNETNMSPSKYRAS